MVKLDTMNKVGSCFNSEAMNTCSTATRAFSRTAVSFRFRSIATESIQTYLKVKTIVVNEKG